MLAHPHNVQPIVLLPEDGLKFFKVDMLAPSYMGSLYQCGNHLLQSALRQFDHLQGRPSIPQQSDYKIASGNGTFARCFGGAVEEGTMACPANGVGRAG